MKSVLHMILILYTVQLYNKIQSPEKSTTGMMDGLLLVTARSLTYMAFIYFPSLPFFDLLSLHFSFSYQMSFTWILFFFLLFPPVISTFHLADLYVLYIIFFSSLHLPPCVPPAVTTRTSILSSPHIFCFSSDCPLLTLFPILFSNKRSVL